MFESNNWLIVIVVGAIAGGIAKLLMPGKDPGGCIITILLGIAGGMLAYFIGQQLGFESTNNGVAIIGSVIGAFIILFIYRLIVRRRR
ncbi:MAG: GlsB/YeaQ/YmgE family stress response membrane protein [Pseudomonadota bacterium]|nr:GlsB/YeaQ/YmgE family stress response membrane protein [Pseudomonadota bacterium]